MVVEQPSDADGTQSLQRLPLLDYMFLTQYMRGSWFAHLLQIHRGRESSSQLTSREWCCHLLPWFQTLVCMLCICMVHLQPKFSTAFAMPCYVHYRLACLGDNGFVFLVLETSIWSSKTPFVRVKTTGLYDVQSWLFDKHYICTTYSWCPRVHSRDRVQGAPLQADNPCCELMATAEQCIVKDYSKLWIIFDLQPHLADQEEWLIILNIVLLRCQWDLSACMASKQ